MTAALLLALALSARALEVRVEPPSAKPGDVLAIFVEDDAPPERLTLNVAGRSVPLYPVAPGRLRALVGLTAETPAGALKAVVTKARRWRAPLTAEASVSVSARPFKAQKLTMAPERARLPSGSGARDAVARIRAVAAVDTPTQRWEGPFFLPVAGRVSSGYGNPRTVNSKPWAWHKGLDVAAPVGSTVTAPAAGVVALAGTYPVQGGTVVIDHGQGVMSALFHLGELLVANGDSVSVSSPVARIGEAGFSTGAHAHWGVYVHGAAVDPDPLLKRAL
ncbi:MAG: lysostaphin [Elusimicrobia bacterium]|nr:MAG: lysostaphin [Elusimicrobiota bacterium]